MTWLVVSYLLIGFVVAYAWARSEVAEYERMGLRMWNFDKTAITIQAMFVAALWPLAVVVAVLDRALADDDGA